MAGGRRGGRGGGGGRGDGGGRGPLDGSEQGSSESIFSGMAYYTSQNRMGQMTSKQREGLNSFLASNLETMNRYIASSGVDPSLICMAPPMILDGVDGDPSASMEDSGPLHEAASMGRMVTCKYLVEQVGFDINAEANNGLGMTPLACAVSHGKTIAAKYLLDKGADPISKTTKALLLCIMLQKKGRTDLCDCCYLKELVLMYYLVKGHHYMLLPRMGSLAPCRFCCSTMQIQTGSRQI